MKRKKRRPTKKRKAGTSGLTVNVVHDELAQRRLFEHLATGIGNEERLSLRNKTNKIRNKVNDAAIVREEDLLGDERALNVLQASAVDDELHATIFALVLELTRASLKMDLSLVDQIVIDVRLGSHAGQVLHKHRIALRVGNRLLEPSAESFLANLRIFVEELHDR